MKIIYIVKYHGGGYDDAYIATIFVTEKKSTAEKYCTRFNTMLKKWKDYYSQFCNTDYGFEQMNPEHIKTKFGRWLALQRVTKCYWEEIEVR